MPVWIFGTRGRVRVRSGNKYRLEGCESMFWGRGRGRVRMNAERGVRVRVSLKSVRGNITNAICCGIMPLSLEHDGRTLLCRCARSNGIIGEA